MYQKVLFTLMLVANLFFVGCKNEGNNKPAYKSQKADEDLLEMPWGDGRIFTTLAGKWQDAADANNVMEIHDGKCVSSRGTETVKMFNNIPSEFRPDNVSGKIYTLIFENAGKKRCNTLMGVSANELKLGEMTKDSTHTVTYKKLN
jgi:hypothetical protein